MEALRLGCFLEKDHSCKQHTGGMGWTTRPQRVWPASPQGWLSGFRPMKSYQGDLGAGPGDT